MRLVRHIAPGNSPKGVALKTMVRSEFKKSMQVLKAGAIRALSNYMLYESGAKDEKLQGAMKRQSDDAVGDLKSSKARQSVQVGLKKMTSDSQSEQCHKKLLMQIKESPHSEC